MDQFKKSLFVMTGFVILIGMLPSARPSYAQQGRPSLPVTVVNTAANPVPIAAQGTTSIQGTVSISGTPDVNVINMPGAQPFFQRLDFGAFGTSLENATQVFTVPAGKRLVIEYMSAHVGVFAGFNSTVLFTLNVGPVPSPLGHLFPATKSVTQVVSPGSEHFLMSSPLRLYVDPGVDVQCRVQRENVNNETTGAGPCFLSGHFVNLP